MARLEIGERVDDLDTAERSLRVQVRHAAFFGRALQHLADEIARFLRRSGARIHHQHVNSAGSGDLRDAAPHRARAKHADGEIGSVRVE